MYKVRLLINWPQHKWRQIKNLFDRYPLLLLCLGTVSVSCSFAIATIVISMVEEEGRLPYSINSVKVLLPTFNFLNHSYKYTVCHFTTNSSPYAYWSSCHVSAALFLRRKQKLIAFRCSCLRCESDILNSGMRHWYTEHANSPSSSLLHYYGLIFLPLV